MKYIIYLIILISIFSCGKEELETRNDKTVIGKWFLDYSYDVTRNNTGIDTTFYKGKPDDWTEFQIENKAVAHLDGGDFAYPYGFAFDTLLTINSYKFKIKSLTEHELIYYMKPNAGDLIYREDRYFK